MSEDQVHTPEPLESTDTGSPVFEDYWGTDDTTKFVLPDGKQFFEIGTLNEGQRAKFQSRTNSDLNIGRDGSTKVRMDQAKERHELIKIAVVGWNLYKRNEHKGEMEPFKFTPEHLDQWLSKAPPKLVDKLLHKIRLFNPFLLGEASPDEIQEQIDELKELKKKAEERDAEKEPSATK